MKLEDLLDRRSFRPRRWGVLMSTTARRVSNEYFAVLLGSLIICFLMLLTYRAGYVFYVPPLVRYLAALAAALLSPLIPGKFMLRGNVRGTVISASLGFALAVFILLFWPKSPAEGEVVRTVAASKRNVLQGVVLNDGQHVGSLNLYFEEGRERIVTDPDGSFSVDMPSSSTLHVEVEGYPRPFEVRIPTTANHAFVRIDVAKPGMVVAE